MTQDTSDGERRLRDRLPEYQQVRAIVFALLLVTSLISATVVQLPGGGVVESAAAAESADVIWNDDASFNPDEITYDSENETVYATGTNSNGETALRALNESGSEIFQTPISIPTPKDIAYDPSTDTVVVVGHNSSHALAYGYHGSDGSEQWSNAEGGAESLGHHYVDVSSDRSEAYVNTWSDAAVDTAPRIAFDTADGTINWEQNDNGRGRGVEYVPSTDNTWTDLNGGLIEERDAADGTKTGRDHEPEAFNYKGQLEAGHDKSVLYATGTEGTSKESVSIGSAPSTDWNVSQNGELSVPDQYGFVLLAQEGDDQIQYLDKDDGSSLRNISATNASAVAPDNDPGGLSLYVAGDSITKIDGQESLSKPITGTAVDQNGNPLPENTTIEAWGIREPALDAGDAQELQREANQLLDELDNATPGDFAPDLDPRDAVADAADTTYVAAHPADDWGMGGRVQIDSEFGTPGVQFGADEEIVLSLWDPDTNAGLLANPIDGSLPGQTTSGTVVVEQLSPTGETLNDKTEYETSTYRTINRVGSGRDIPAVELDLPPGYYRIYPKSSSVGAGGYVIAVGDANEQYTALASDLRDRANNRVQRAQNILDRINNEQIARRTTTTDENGTFALDVPNDVVSVQIHAMRANGDILQDVSEPSLDDLREARTLQGYNGSVIIPSPTPKRVQPPAENVTVRGFRSPTIPFEDVSSWADLSSWLEDQRLNETIADLEAEYQQRLNETERATLAAQYSSTRPLVETAPGAEDRYLSDSEFEEIQPAEDLSKDELATELSLMRQALFTTDPIDVEPPEAPDISDPSEGISNLTAEFAVPEGVTEDAINPTIRWSDGTTDPVPDEHWSLESGGLFGATQTVSIDYPLDDSDPPSGTLVVQAAMGDDGGIGGGENGGVGEGSVPITNPTFRGAVPSVPAVDLSTLAPGASDRVSMTLRPEEGTGYGELVAIDARNAQGEAVDASVTDDYSAWMDTDGQGVHTAWLTYENDGGQRFQRAVTVRAQEAPGSGPPTIRVSEGAGGPFAVVGNGLQSAQVERSGTTVDITAVAPADGDVPGQLSVKPGVVMDASTTDLNVQVVQGDDRQSVSAHTRVDIHLDSVASESALWRGEPTWWGGQPLSVGSSASYGEAQKVNDEGKVVIRTVTDSSGSVSVTVDEDVGLLDGLRHSIAGSTPDIFEYIPIGWIPNPAAGSTVGLIGLAGYARRRRAQAP